MAVTVASFRSTFPEFSDVSLYPDDSITFWMSVAVQMVNANRWKSMTDTGVMLLGAHYLVFAAKDQMAAEAGGVPGEATGNVSSKSVDKVSVSYDSSAITASDAKGDLALSSYGIRFARLAKMFGAGGLQIA
jgi:hypothetical protein